MTDDDHMDQPSLTDKPADRQPTDRQEGGPDRPASLDARQRGVLATVFVMTLISTFMGSALNLSITDISSEFQSGVTAVTWIVNIFTIMVAAFSVPFGHLGDIGDRRRIFLISIAMFSFTSLFCAFATSVGWLILGRGLMSIAGAAIGAVNIPILLAVSPPSMRGRMIGYSVTAVYLGLSIGPVLGGVLNETLGWRSIFILAFILPAISFFLGVKYFPHEKSAKGAKHDIAGNLVYLVMIITLMLGLSLWKSGWWAKALVICGVALLVVFIMIERRAEAPAVQVRLFASNAGYTLSNLAALLNYGATFAISYTMSIYLQNVIGLPTSLAGIVLISQPLVMTVVSPFAGRMSDHIAPYRIASVGMAVTAVGLFLMSTVHAGSSVASIVCFLIIIGLGFGLFSSPNTNAVISCVDRSHVGEANAILGTMRSLGMSISMVVVLFIFGSRLGNVVVASASSDALIAATHTAMLVFAFTCVLGTLISLVRGKAPASIR